MGVGTYSFAILPLVLLLLRRPRLSWSCCCHYCCCFVQPSSITMADIAAAALPPLPPPPPPSPLGRISVSQAHYQRAPHSPVPKLDSFACISFPLELSPPPLMLLLLNLPSFAGHHYHRAPARRHSCGLQAPRLPISMHVLWRGALSHPILLHTLSPPAPQEVEPCLCTSPTS